MNVDSCLKVDYNELPSFSHIPEIVCTIFFLIFLQTISIKVVYKNLAELIFWSLALDVWYQAHLAVWEHSEDEQTRMVCGASISIYLWFWLWLFKWVYLVQFSLNIDHHCFVAIKTSTAAPTYLPPGNVERPLEDFPNLADNDEVKRCHNGGSGNELSHLRFQLKIH